MTLLFCKKKRGSCSRVFAFISLDCAFLAYAHQLLTQHGVRIVGKAKKESDHQSL
jgi:hypothetical protein